MTGLFEGDPPSEEEVIEAYRKLGFVYKPAKAHLTEDEHILLVDMKNKYWQAFSKLINGLLLEVPEDIRPHLEEMMQEASSVYGRDTDA